MNIWKKTNRLLSFDTTRTAQKTTPPTILRVRRNVFTELLPVNDRGLHRQTHRHKHGNPSTVWGIRRRGNVFTEPLPSNERMAILYQDFCLAKIGDIYIYTHTHTD
jgi:hypothetical protein